MEIVYNFTEARFLFGIMAAARYFGVSCITVKRHIEKEFENCGDFIP